MIAPAPLTIRRVDRLHVRTYATKSVLGAAAAAHAAEVIRVAIEDHGAARVIFATGASQFEFLEALVQQSSVNWSCVTAFHLDEYLGLPSDHPASFRGYLNERLFNLVKPARVHLIAGDAPDPDGECERYAALLAAEPIDLACIGIGENGHIAFNDPPVADFRDPRLVKIVELDEPCRRQQLGEGWFPTLDDVPRRAMTLTVPAIMRCKAIRCVVPDERKAEAVRAALEEPIGTACPASVLRRHADAVLFLDELSASRI